MISALTGARILLVEDEALVAMMLEDMLTDLGCVVVGPAARVDDAMLLVEGEAIDAAVLDVNLANETVFPVARALAARGVPFVFGTGYARPEMLGDFADRPVLHKPYRSSDLSEAIRSITPREGGDPLPRS
ncbi:MAG: response regulator receiver protein [Rhodospirillales bacterium]|nr:response regulator receiver protein [Rhodospirillales bacterium]